jgi:hypothetical protein
MAYELDSYIKLIPPQHRWLTYFPQVVSASVEGPAALSGSVASWPGYFNFQTAVGNQLDILGEWIGFRRYLRVEITGVYFTWDSTPELGWDSGYWQGPFDSVSQVRALGDDDYRRLLTTLIQVNHWDGSFSQMLTNWTGYLSELGYTINRWYDYNPTDGAIAYWDDAETWHDYDGHETKLIDNQDMTMTVVVLGDAPVGARKAITKLALGFVKPAAVRIREVVTPVSGGDQLFAWDADTDYLSGWAVGTWPAALDFGQITGLGQDPNPILNSELPPIPVED